MRSSQRCSDSFSCVEKYSLTSKPTFPLAAAAVFPAAGWLDLAEASLPWSFPLLFLWISPLAPPWQQLRAWKGSRRPRSQDVPTCTAAFCRGERPASTHPTCAALAEPSPRPCQNPIEYSCEP